jgi:hypothetical protein
MFRLYREIEKGEFFVVFGDCAQGGIDSNYVQFLSKTKMDFPLVFQMHGVAAEATPYIRQALEWIYDQTGVKPVFAFERQQGGTSEMYNLNMTNQQGKYRLYHPKSEDDTDKDKLGWDTNSVTRPNMLGEWLTAFNSQLFRIYDQDTIDQHQTFIVNKNGRPEADANTHDDAVMSCAGAYQLYQTENPITIPKRTRERPKKTKFHV